MTDEQVRQYQSLLEHVPCNLCGADDYAIVYPPVYEKAKPDAIMETFRSSGDEVLLDQMVRCNVCGLQYLNPRLRTELIVDGYSQGSDENFVSQVEGRERTFVKSLDLIEKHRPGRGRILDIGTAGGSFLAVAKQRGWEVAGCEPNRWLSAWGKDYYGIDIVPGTVFDMQLAEESFDVITLWDVLEHTPSPTAVLEECHRLLKPGGMLVTNVPNSDSLVARLMGRRWVFLLSIHLYYFTPDTLEGMLQKIGFKLLKHRTHWQTLELGYILFRMQAYLSSLAELGGKLAKALRLQHLQIPYNMGQTLFLAEKI